MSSTGTVAPDLRHEAEIGVAVPDALALSLRAVHRAASELRRGTPVLIMGPGGSGPGGNRPGGNSPDRAGAGPEDAAGGPLLVAAAETVGARGLAEIAAAALQPPLLLLAPVRAAAVLHRPVAAAAVQREEGVVALRPPAALLAPEALRRLADPVAERLLPELPELLPAPPLAPAALALAKLSRLLPALVAAPVQAEAAARLGLLAVPAADVLAYPASAAASLTRVAEARVPLEDARDARIVAFRAADGGIEHLALLVGEPEKLAAAGGAPLVRAHSECFTGDLLGSLRCDCGPQLRGAIHRMAQEGSGVLLYLAQEGRGIGLVNKLRAYTLQDGGLDTLDANRALGYGADERGFLVAATMLEQLGIRRVRLLTNNPDKMAGLAACGITVEGREAHQFAANGVNNGYLATKAARFGHLLG